MGGLNPQELNARLRRSFLDELADHARALQAGALELRAQPAAEGQAENLRAVFRTFHTVKGAARAAGVPLLERVAHRFEGQWGALRDSGEPIGPEWFSRLLLAVDALTESGARLENSQALPGQKLVALFAAVGETVALASEAGPSPLATRTTVRASTEKLDALLQASARASLAAENEDFAPLLVSLKLSTEKLGGSSDAARGVAQGLAALERRLDGFQRAVRQSVQDVSDAALKVRLSPFEDTCRGLDRVLHELASATKKSARLVCRDGAVELDRHVLETVSDALLHLVRNAVDHGLELPDARAAKGKPREGTVTVSAELSGELVRISVSDDGGGIDWPKVRQAARARGLGEARDAAALKELLFTPGLSASPQVTEVSGRGVGLDVVRSKVALLRGTVELVETAQGTQFTLVVPVTLSRLRVLLLGEADRVYGVPSYGIARILRIDRAALGRVAGRQVIVAEGNLPLTALASVLGVAGAAASSERLNVVVLEWGGVREALEVAHIQEEREVTVHPLGERFAGTRQLLGAAFLPGGRIAPILDPLGLMQRAQRLTAAAPAAVAEVRPAHRLLLADDSPTTRMLERIILESHGYEVLLAADGAEAWQLLQQEKVDLVVSDVEMPAMNGLELTQAIRASARLAGLPVVLVTGLASETDRQRGLEAGANGYVVKTAFDQKDLLEIIGQLLEG
jgi:two-component system chemotaxis sensor kinase CheA